MSAPEETKPEQGVKPKRRHTPIVVGTIISLLIAGLAGGYLWVASSYSLKYLPGTYINGLNMGSRTSMEAARALDRLAEDYRVDVYGRGEDGNSVLLGSVTSADVDLTCEDNLGLAEELLQSQPRYLWPKYLWFDGREDHQLTPRFRYDHDKMVRCIMDFPDLQTGFMKNAVNATISEYSEALGSYEIVPEQYGNSVKRAQLREILKREELFQPGITVLNLEDLDVYRSPSVKADDPDLARELETANRWVGTVLAYDWVGETVIVDGDIIHEWISFDRGKPVLDEEAAAEFVRQTSKENDNFGQKITFETALGNEIKVSKSRYGWQTDREETTRQMLDLIREGANQVCEPVYSVEGYGKPQYGLGDSYVEIDLGNQHLYLHNEGEIVLESDFVSGNMSNGNGTPEGLYGLTYKTRDAVLRGANYQTPVKYWMPFNGNVGMHDATWRREFGGEIYLTNGSHGCINLPLSKAREIYEYVSTGFPVVCYY